jgi:hypothetical protein
VRTVFDSKRALYVTPQDVDLEKKLDSIVQYEPPRNWGIDPFKYL